jgi:glycosyltransferase involved in cell wall biosynthesis
MDYGLAVVASDVGGIPEVVVAGETGILVPPSDPDQMEKAILTLYRDQDLRRSMGEAGKQRSQKFTAQVMAEKYLRVYRELES